MSQKPPADLTSVEAPEKQLMNEVLPPPEPVIPSQSRSGPRARVQEHMRGLLSLGAASLTLSCGPMVCDPLPPPPMCRSTPGSVLSSIQVSVNPVGTTSAVDVVIRTLDDPGRAGVSLTLTTITGGTASLQTSDFPVVMTQRVTPASASSVVELVLGAQCEGLAAKPIKVVLTPSPADAGSADAGVGSYRITVTE